MGGHISLLDGPSVQLAMLGLDSAGKTTVLYRLKFDQYTNPVPTIGFNYEKIRVKTGKAKGATFCIWDVGGRDKTRPLWKSYTRSADGIVFVVDSVNREKLEEARVELLRLLRSLEGNSLPVLIIANKQDLPASMSPEEIEKFLTLNEASPGLLWHVQPACAVTGEGLMEAMDVMFEMIEKKKKINKQIKKKR
ncbi:ADP-ribosylation factor-like protein 4C [Argonauta hians]